MPKKSKKVLRKKRPVAYGSVPIETRESGGEMQYSKVSLFASEVIALAGAQNINFALSKFTTLVGTRPLKIMSLRASVVSDVTPIVWRLNNALDGKTTSKCLQVNGTNPRFMLLTPNPGADYVSVTQATDLAKIIVDVPGIDTGKITVLVEIIASVGFQFS